MLAEHRARRFHRSREDGFRQSGAVHPPNWRSDSSLVPKPSVQARTTTVEGGPCPQQGRQIGRGRSKENIGLAHGPSAFQRRYCNQQRTAAPTRKPPSGAVTWFGGFTFSGSSGQQQPQWQEDFMTTHRPSPSHHTQFVVHGLGPHIQRTRTEKYLQVPFEQSLKLA